MNAKAILPLLFGLALSPAAAGFTVSFTASGFGEPSGRFQRAEGDYSNGVRVAVGVFQEGFDPMDPSHDFDTLVAAFSEFGSDVTAPLLGSFDGSAVITTENVEGFAGRPVWVLAHWPADVSQALQMGCFGSQTSGWTGLSDFFLDLLEIEAPQADMAARGSVVVTGETRDLRLETIEDRLPEVFINELMYHPAGIGAEVEFVELRNASSSIVDLFDPADPGAGALLDGIGFTFPPGFSLNPGEIVLVVNVPPDDFRAQYGVPDGVRVLGSFPGFLSNAGEEVRLRLPIGEAFVDLDIVGYDDGDPWPSSADGGGSSLERKLSAGDGSDHGRWRASLGIGGTPGFANTAFYVDWVETQFSLDEQGDPLVAGLLANPAGDGVANLQKFAFGLDPGRRSLSGLPRLGLEVVDGELYVSIEFRRRPYPGDLEYRIQSSGDLVTWSDGGVEVAVLPEDEGVETVTVRDVIPLHGDSAPLRTLRLVVTHSSP